MMVNLLMYHAGMTKPTGLTRLTELTRLTTFWKIAVQEIWWSCKGETSCNFAFLKEKYTIILNCRNWQNLMVY
jgi:hypothetical protein